MQQHNFEWLYQIEEHYWWFPAMRAITDTIARSALQKPNLRILDAGCGTGFNLTHYAAADSRDVYGLDLAAAALEHVRKRGFEKVAQASITHIPFKSETFDIVFSFEAVTQTPHETHDASIREMHRVLKNGGYLFIRVPAYMWLRSSHDEEQGDLYRYTRNELVKRLTAAGFEIEWTSYANTFLFPVVLLRRFLKRAGIAGGSDVKPLPRGLGWLNGIFRAVLASEAKWFESGRRLPFGVSLIGYAQKKNLELPR